ncbi:uncharacterized protein LOC100888055 [Strongylocentrotus purpuratus]|uniref:Uncharacterized protein n=1 Tax=Strongylocentrotus purpuratus TaxID=7668 RepID=A0A7M7P913_STRPU|nr:uncharacterized protein LOC100888055 [Strongylocentrotus purpuratus]
MMSTSAAESYPKWLSDCKSELSHSQEWQDLREELESAIEQQLTESHVDQFANLSIAERKMFLERALRAVKNGDQCGKFNDTLNQSINKHVNSHVAHQLLDKSGFKPVATKSDLILDQSNEASMALLARWPELKTKLHRCFNKVLPSGLRQLTWKLYLSNPTVRSRYLTRLERDPQSTMSVLDLDVVKKCEALLQSEPTFKLLAFNTDILHAMKAVLSYHHACKQTRTPLLDTDYLLVVPFLVNALMVQGQGHRIPGESGTLTGPGTDHLISRESLGTLVEQYSTLMAARPAYMKESYNQDFKEGLRQCLAKVSGTLEVLDSGLADHLRKALNKEAKKLPLSESIKQVTRPMIRAMFVGYLSLDTIMYVWDQHMIGLDAPEFDITPAITVLIFIYLKKQLMSCNTVSEVSAILKSEAVKLKREQFMHGINKLFHKELYSLLIKDSGMPVLDPTQMPMPWQDWHRDDLPPVIRAEDRQISRQRRREEELREMNLKKELHDQRLLDEDLRKQQARVRWQQQLTDAEKAYSSREVELIKLLEEEKKKRVEASKRAEREIDKLAKEIEKLRKGQGSKPGPSTVPLCPSRVGRDLLKGVMKGANTLADGSSNDGR